MNSVNRDVAIIGAGPAGVTLANLLAEYEISVIVMDREAYVLEEPRAVGIDDEALRTLQSFGMAEKVLESAVRNAPIRYYDSRNRILAHVAPSARPFGWPRRNLFFQPNLESVLRTSLDRFDNVEFRTSCEAVGLTQDVDRVTVTALENGETVTIRARYVVGADGGRSFVRDAVGIELEGDTAPMKWLVVDVKDDTWDAQYSAVYTSPERPSMTIPLPFGYRRFEFKVLDGEDPDRMAEPATVAKLMKKFYPDSDVPPAVRRRIYWHHSRTASTFQAGRAFLVGDAAHLQPPFFGQGMNSGMRDVTNLAWKLGMVLSGTATPRLLETYDSERREIARSMVQFVTGVGRLYHPKNRFTEELRNLLFRGVQLVPGGRDYILQMKYKPVPRYTDGFVVPSAGTGRSPLLGRAFPQPMVEMLDGTRLRLDDVLGARIAIVGVVGGVAEAIPPQILSRFAAHNGVVVQVHVPSSYRRQGQFDPAKRVSNGEIPVVDIYDLEGGLRDLYLATPQDEVYIVRPDRYVAAVSSVQDLDLTLERVLRLLDGPDSEDLDPREPEL
ncbi:bifunctional 3-(3-hydroxy-phenyl)propionate/3-hydroxycinnamic acid hydroxylase [Rhodococcus oxybenzonivorans]|uniref:bifunctional 3-(3-hydroxy-phenyl)propionate/3-hydroxycinnamic acid hydroxylase n=1 Tax=Rhodococcus oxybenzonivorans TaxID=1990687 RepID=UPI002955D0F9|nr:bifunctional 3-(3-hydroxy-phenyl)propionate/3-hydroxycinnamic acid hydroxylase [Rhodococcus oxybenzonivorans]MDV7352711.1 bifunctional 3-(3-hydroxy-phenyl)propionate/3-hydroxycinnamic acid hydroxylase [Rhodococcus oxybenzonivorans]